MTPRPPFPFACRWRPAPCSPEWALEALAKLGLVAQDALVGEVGHGVVLVEFVLQGRPRQQHAPLGGQLVERLGRERGVVLQPVGLVANQQIALVVAVELFCVRPERLVADDEHRRRGTATGKVSDVALDVLRLAARDALDPPVQPLFDLLLPIEH